MHADYAQAVLLARTREGASDESVVTGLIRNLKETGRMKLLPGILRELKRLEARAAKTAPTLELASEKDRAAAEAVLAAAGVTPRETIVNPSLIRGWRARANGVLMDRSAKRALIDIYQKITN